MKKKFLKILVVMIILIITYASIVNALSLTVTMDTTSPIVDESTEFTIKVKVSNLDVGPNGITTLSGYIKFSKEIFENISESSIEGVNGWSAQYATDSTKVTLTKQTFVKNDEEVFNITLKTKPGTSGKEDEIKFTNIMASNNDTEISAADVSIKIMVGKVTGNIANVTNTSNTNAIVPIVQNRVNNITVNKTVNNVVNNSLPSFVNTTNETEDDIPYTGVEDSIPFILVGIVALAIVFYIKIEKLNNDMK